MSQADGDQVVLLHQFVVVWVAVHAFLGPHQILLPIDEQAGLSQLKNPT